MKPPVDPVNDRCRRCRRPLRFGNWMRITGDEPTHVDCDSARIRELEHAIDRIWSQTGCFRTTEAVGVAANCHDIAEEVR